MIERTVVRGALGHLNPDSIPARHIKRWSSWLRQVVMRGGAGSTDDGEEFQRVLHRDLVEPGLTELTPRLWEELRGERAHVELRHRVEAATEVFPDGDRDLLALMVVYSIRLVSMTERHWHVPLADFKGRLPACRAVTKATGALQVVLDPHVYDPAALHGISPRALRDRLVHLLDFPLGCGRQPDPIVEPMKLRATPDPEWQSAVCLGVGAYRHGQPLVARDPSRVFDLAPTHFLCEIGFPLDPMRMMSARILPEVKCEGVLSWHAGLREAIESLRRYRLGQQAWLGDSSRLVRERRTRI